MANFHAKLLGRRLAVRRAALGLAGAAVVTTALAQLPVPIRPWQPSPANVAAARTRDARLLGGQLKVRRLPKHYNTQTGELVTEGKTHVLVEQLPGSCGPRNLNARHAPLEQLVSTNCLFGPHCLVFEGYQAPSGCSSDRIELDLAEYPNGIRYGDTAHLRFFIRVDPRVTGLTTSALISQVWQYASIQIGNRPPLGPPFAISLHSNAENPDLIDTQFRYRDEVSAENPPHFFLIQPITKGQWHSFDVRLTPRHVGHPDGPGEILVWLDAGTGPNFDPKRALNYDERDSSRYRFHWGYPPDPQTRLGPTFEVRVGIYRPEPLTWMKFWLDGVELTREPAANALAP